eukprot:2019290-Rhodomonas_salina.5
MQQPNRGHEGQGRRGTQRSRLPSASSSSRLPPFSRAMLLFMPAMLLYMDALLLLMGAMPSFL